MLHPVYRLAIDIERRFRLEATARRAWRPTLLVPREMCLFEAVPAAGVAFHEQAGFARLQALRLSPFAATGVSAALRGKTLMLWFWDEADLASVFADAGIDAARLRRVCETLWLAPARVQGEARQPSAGGVDLQTWQQGAIVRSSWQDDPAAKASPLLSRPWARELIGMRAGMAGSVAAPRVTLQGALTVASTAAAIGCAAYAAYWGGMLIGGQDRLATLEADASATTSKLGSLADMRRAARSDRDWVQNYRRLGAGVQVEALLAALRGPFERYGVTIKELEVRNAEVRVGVVSAGAEIDLPGLLGSLTQVAGFDDVQLRQNVDATQATFGLKATGFVGGTAAIGTRSP